MVSALGRTITPRMFTDSKQVFGVITMGRRPPERCLAINARTVRESYERKEIDRLGPICATENPAGALTKMNSNNTWKMILSNGRDQTSIQELIVGTEDQFHKD